MINSGDTAWMLISSALVMLMTPAGLTLFYGGLTQRKSVLNTIGMSYTAFCTASFFTHGLVFSATRCGFCGVPLLFESSSKMSSMSITFDRDEGLDGVDA